MRPSGRPATGSTGGRALGRDPRLGEDRGEVALGDLGVRGTDEGRAGVAGEAVERVGSEAGHLTSVSVRRPP